MKNKAFTLIELLVVISVIGLLASIILISIKNVRDKTKRAADLQFSSSIHHALGAYAVGIWDFDDQTTNDSSGYENDGTIYGGATFISGNTPSGKGYVLNFDGIDDSVVTPSLSSYIGNEVTISAWIKADELPSGYHGFLMSGGGGLFTYGYGLYMRVYNSVNVYGQTAITITTGEWFHIVGTYDSINIKLYKNGEEVNSQSFGPDLRAFGGLNMGYYGGYFDGLIDEARIYEQALTSAQIKQLYVEGAKLHENKLAEKK